MNNDQNHSQLKPSTNINPLADSNAGEAHPAPAVTPPGTDANPVSSPAPSEQPISTDDVKVAALVVEDNEDYQVIFKNILQLAGYEVTVARDGLEALRVFQEKQFFLAFLDLQMPGMDGLSVLRSIRQRPEYDGMYVLIITANAHMTAGSVSDLADFVLLKPVNVLELAALAKRFKNVPRRPGIQGDRPMLNSVQGGSQ